jgi:hypothetical protein
MSTCVNIFDAAREGTVEDMRYLIEEKGVDVNSKNYDKPFVRGVTPLHTAAYYGNIEVVKFLVSKGADVNVNDKVKTTIFFSSTSNPSRVKTKEKNENYSTPLHMAAADTGNAVHDTGKVEVAKYLISKGASVNAKGPDGVRPVDLARGRVCIEEIFNYSRPQVDGSTLLCWGEDGQYGRMRIVMKQCLENAGGRPSSGENEIGIGKVLKFVAIGVGIIIFIAMCSNC